MDEKTKEKKPEKIKGLNIENLQKELKECQKEKQDFLAGWKRARADFLNYKKEETERIKEFSSYATEGLILKILPILDNFNLVEKKLPKDLKDNEYINGLLQIKTQLEDFLKGQGVQEIKCVKEEFDPNFHEAIQEIEKSDSESGTILEEIQKGYKIGDKLLRPAKVKITK